jgi:DNA-binding NtrC family response regulator
MNSPRIKVLIAEDEANLAQLLDQFLVSRGHSVTTTHDGRAALDALKAESFDVALLDIVMPEMDGLEVLRQLRTEASPPEVIIITGNGTIETAISAIRLGAYDYLSKPYRMAEIDVLVRRAWEKKQLTKENALLHDRLARKDGLPEIITQHAAMRAVLTLVERVAKSDSPVLVSGDSGTGKELVARALHRLSGRSGPLVDINCAAIAESMLESELFGHEQGAFPGADSQKLGLFELAAGGTLFMDGISELEPRMQGKLLRALETGSFFRVGGTQKVEVNVRIVTATNRDLARAVNDGTFRGDLLYRINTISINLPPLRERAVDIPLLTEYFLKHFGGAAPPRISPEAIEALQQYSWPGNVRELRNVIERAVLLANDGTITARDLPLSGSAPARESTTASNGNGDEHAAAQLSLADLERRHIETVLTRVHWHQGRAATALGISTKTLYRKIREYGFQRPK